MSHFEFTPSYENPREAWTRGFKAAVGIILHEIDSDKDSSEVDYKTLNLWINVGRHVTHGKWAILGARQATYMILHTLWDHTSIEKPNTLDELFDSVESSDPDHVCGLIATELNGSLDEILSFLWIDSGVSRFITEIR